jgi:hypothetical protein
MMQPKEEKAHQRKRERHFVSGEARCAQNVTKTLSASHIYRTLIYVPVTELRAGTTAARFLEK